MKFTTFSLISAMLGAAYGHMGIVEPTPRLTGDTLKSPIGSAQAGDGLPLCGVETQGSPQTTIKAGESVTLKFTNHGATHGGGHCQFAISYDNQKFAVIQDELKHCFKKGPSSDNTPEITSYDVKLPADLPSGNAVLAWTWINAIGNREYYMGCVDVAVDGKEGGSFSGPELLVVNHPKYGGGVTIPEFNGNYETGLDLFNGRKNIEVGPGGSGGQDSSPAPKAAVGTGSGVPAASAGASVSTGVGIGANVGIGAAVGVGAFGSGLSVSAQGAIPSQAPGTPQSANTSGEAQQQQQQKWWW